jgi:hypothetical protein
MKFIMKFLRKVFTPDADYAKEFVEHCFDSKHGDHLMDFLGKEFKGYKSMNDPDHEEVPMTNLQETKMVATCLAAVVSLCPKKQIAIDMLMGMYDLSDEYEEYAKNHKCEECEKKPSNSPGNRSVH